MAESEEYSEARTNLDIAVAKQNCRDRYIALEALFEELPEDTKAQYRERAEEETSRIAREAAELARAHFA